MKAKIYHNPRCSKSRAALALLTERGVDLTVIDYLREPPSKESLRRLLQKLDGDALTLVRGNEPESKGLAADAGTEQVLDWLTEHPRVLQRPIVETDDRAVIGRPLERVLELFE